MSLLETFNTPGPVMLSLRIPSGTIELEATETDETQVRVDRKRGALDSGELVVEMHDKAGRQEVVVHSRRSGFRMKERSYKVSVRLPAGSDLEVATASADLTAKGRFGSTDVKAASGDIHLDEVDGTLRAHTASGDIAIGSAGGDAVIRSASGDVELGEAGEGVRIQTASGDMSLGSVSKGEIKLQSASGDVEVGVRSGSSVFIDATSMSGDMRSDLDVADGPGGNSDPDVEIRAITMSGDVTIRRA